MIRFPIAIKELELLSGFINQASAARFSPSIRQ
jgi:hypothetical protein